MPSSISSSKRARSLPITIGLWAGAALALWTALCQTVLPEVSNGQTQEATNRIRVERFLDGEEPEARWLIVGSSLSYRLPEKILEPRIANIALAGGSPLTGLALVADGPIKPERVLIEINEVDTPDDPAFLAKLAQEPWRSLRPTLRAARHAYQPTNLLFGLLKGDGRGDDRLLPAAMRATILERRRADYETLDDQALIDGNVAALARLVERLGADGIAVAFFEMPVADGLAGLAQPVQIRDAVLKRFPRERWCWLDLSGDPPPETNDGLHLLAADAARVAHRLVDQAATCPK